jgi:ketosteroid isomerase-like protein
MSVASDLVRRHIETLVADNAQWQTLLADEIVWELPYAPSLGHPGRLEGRDVVIRHANWFLQTVTDFRFFDLRVYAFADPDGALAEVKAEGTIKPTGRRYVQDYVVLLGSSNGKIVSLREYFDPVRASKAMIE